MKLPYVHVFNIQNFRIIQNFSISTNFKPHVPDKAAFYGKNTNIPHINPNNTYVFFVQNNNLSWKNICQRFSGILTRKERNFVIENIKVHKYKALFVVIIDWLFEF